MDPATVTAPTILIVGGVAGGASAAARARRMNEQARIVILEKDAYVSFANCGLPYYLGGEITDRERLLIAKPALFERRFRIEVRTRHEVVSIDRAARTISVQDLEAGRRYEEHYDKLILAPGASPLVPPIPGVDARGVFTLRTLDDADRIAAAMPRVRRGRRRGWRLRRPGDRRAVPPPRARGGARRDAVAGHAAAGPRDG